MHIDTFSHTHSNFHEATLLVVEDQEDVWFLTQFALSKGLPEVTIVRVASYTQAMAYLNDLLERSQDLPKLILQDLYMPNREDGLELLRAIRHKLAIGLHPQLPIVIMSSSTNPDDIQQCYRAGCSAYLIKATTISQQIADFSTLRQFWWETGVLPLNASRL